MSLKNIKNNYLEEIKKKPFINNKLIKNDNFPSTNKLLNNIRTNNVILPNIIKNSFNKN